ncbi:hypothetical protein STEG23_032293 [Scotinomys teguina]
MFGCGSLHLPPSVTGEKLCDDRVFTDLITGLKSNLGAGTIAQSVKHLPHKCKGLSLDAQNLREKLLGPVRHTCDPNVGEIMYYVYHITLNKHRLESVVQTIIP